MADNQTAIIEIANIESSPYGVKITDTNKKVYNVSKTKKDGSLSVAWQQLGTMDLKAPNPLTETPGDQVEIWYREVPNKHGGISRYISSFTEAGGRSVTPVSAPVKQSHSEANRGQSEGFKSIDITSPSPNGSRNYDQEGYEKCAWTYFIEVCHGDLEAFAKALQEGVVHDAFQAIKADSRKQFSPLRQAVQRSAQNVLIPPEEDLPVIQQEEPPYDVNVEDVPF